MLVKTEVKKVLRTSAFSVLLVTNSPLFLFLLVVYLPEEPFLVVFDISGQFQFELSFCFSNCISVCPGNALVVLNGYSFAFPSLVRFSLGFEQTQKLAVKPNFNFPL